MSLRVIRSLRHMIPEVSPPDDPEVPHEWLAESWEATDKEFPALVAAMVKVVPLDGHYPYWIRVSCRHCRTVCVAGFGRTAASVVAAITAVRRWPVPASCTEALVREVMES